MIIIQRIALFCILTGLIFQQSFAQQYIPFAQHSLNMMPVNPAYAGYKEDLTTNFGFRSQWTGMDGAPKSGYISIDGVLDENLKRNGVGAQLSYDKIGVQSAISMYGNYALRLQIDDADEQRLSLGLSAGFTQYSLDGTKLDPIDENDPLVPRGIVSSFRPDIRLGAFFNTKNWYVGLSVHDLFTGADSREDFLYNQNAIESIYRKTHGYLMLGALFNLQEGLLLKPSFLLKDDLKGPSNLDVNLMFIFDRKLWIGGGYRTRSRLFNRDYENYGSVKFSNTSSINLMSQVYTSERIRIGYSYDFMLNKISGINANTHEVTIGYTLGKLKPAHLMKYKYF